MIRVGVVGLGRMGMSHFAVANANPGAMVAAVCEPSSFVRGAIEKHSNVPCYKTMDEMLRSVPLDAVFITTPTRLHYEMTRMALEAGLHVFVEKPFCLSPEEGLELVKLAGQRDVVNQVGYHSRFLGTFQEARRLLDSKSIGNVYHVLGEVYGPVVLRESKKTWRSDPAKGGGCLYDYATHIVNLMQYLVGPPEEVSGAVLQSIFSVDVPDAVYCTLRYGSGASGQVRANWSDDTYRKLSMQVTLLGTKGKIRVDAQEMHAHFREQPDDESYEKGWNVRYITDLAPDVCFYLRGEEYSAQVEHFLRCIEQDQVQNINSFAEANITDGTIDLIKTVANGSQG